MAKRRFNWLADPILHLLLTAIAIAGYGTWQSARPYREGVPISPDMIMLSPAIEHKEGHPPLIGPWDAAKHGLPSGHEAAIPVG